MSRVHCRCRNCGTRRVLRLHPSKYQVVPACRVCGKRYVYVKGRRHVCEGEGVREPVFRVDEWMNRRNTRAMGCMCSGYCWAGNMSGAMHRRGSLRCWYRKEGTRREYGDDDFFVDPDQLVMDYEHG